MNVLICAHDAPNYINGPNIWLQRTLPELQRQGVHCRVLFFPSSAPESCPTIKALNSQGIECEIYRGRNYSEFQVPWILERVRAKPTDIFVPNLRVPGYHASPWIKESGIPTVGVLHSDDAFYRALVDEFIRKPCPSPLTAVVCVSDHLAAHVEDCAPGKVLTRTIPYGVPLPKDVAQPSEVVRIVYAGRLVEKQKRIGDLTRALCLATSQVPGTEAILYGSGSGESRVAAIIAEHGMEGRVRLGGLMNKEELQERMLEAHVFALLSDYEGLPIALLEAMACGLVPICTPMLSGIPQLIQDGKNGFVVADRERSFVGAIRRLKTEPGLWSRMSAAARSQVKEAYSVDSSVKQWKQLFNELGSHSAQTFDPLVVPRRIRLGPEHPDIDPNQDRRWPGYAAYYAGLLRSRAAKLMR